MKLKYLLPMAAFALPLIAGAVPAKPGVHQVKNPDGTTVAIRCFGDEHFSYYTDAQGKTIYQTDSEGNLVPMIRNGKTLEVTTANIEMLRAEQNAADMNEAGATRPQRMAALTDDGRTVFPTIGKVKSLVVLVEFSDRKFVIPDIKQKFIDLCNKKGYDAYGARGSAADYYRASSDNQFDPQFDVYGPVQLTKTAGYITGADLPNGGKYSRMSELIKESLTILDKEGLDFTQYDYDNDGMVDNVFFFFAGHGQADYYGDPTYGYEYPKNTCIWPHNSSVSGISFDGKLIKSYACSMELDGGKSRINNRWLTGIGTFCHEFGHVLGLPDLYDTQNGSTEVPGAWDTMCSGSYNMDSTCPPLFSSYEKWVCKWLEYNVAKDSTHYTIPPLATELKESEMGKPDPRMVRFNIPDGLNNPRTDEYYLIENRTRQGFDTSVPAEGMLIWHINFRMSTWRGNTVNCYNRPYVIMLRPDKSFSSYIWPSSDGKINAIHPDDGIINNASYNTTEFKDFITSMNYDSTTKMASFDFNMIKEYPQDSTEMVSWNVPDNSKREYTVTWKPLEGVDDYLLTVYYLDANGNKVYMDNNNERRVGNVTSWTVRNLTNTQWTKREHHVYVRTSKVLPSKKISNELVFTPGLDAVNDIKVDYDIKGGVGCVTAPENAKVYNFAGMQVGKENLAKGIYIVRYAGKAVKVVVR